MAANPAAGSGVVFGSSSAPIGKIQKPPVTVYGWNVAHRLLAPPNQKTTREAIGKIPGAMVIEESAEQIDAPLLDAVRFYRPKG
jgi:hypothetical protein